MNVCAWQWTLCQLFGAPLEVEGKWECVQREIISSGLAVVFCGISMSSGVGMTNLDGDAGVGIIADDA